MSKPLLILVTLIYAYISLESFLKGNHGMGVTYAGYAMANLGLLSFL